MKDNSKFGSSQSLIDAVNEVLKGGQKKLDKNNNGKLDSEDFKKLRGEDHEVKPASNAQIGDKVHAGIGRKGGAGYSGVITKVDDTHAYIKVGETGKFGDRIVKSPHKLVTNYSRISEVAENLPMREEEVEQADEGFKSAKMEINRMKAARAKNDAIAVAFNKKEKEKDTKKELPMRKESALGDLLGSEKGVRKISPRKDEHGNEIKNPARSLARKAMKSFAAKAMELPMRKEDAVTKAIKSIRAKQMDEGSSEPEPTHVVTFQKGNVVGARSRRSVYVNAKHEDEAREKARKEFPEHKKEGYKLHHVHTMRS